MSEACVRAQSVSKKYCKRLRRAMLYGAQDLLRDCLSLNRHGESLRTAEFWAIKDLTFELRKGEWLGIVGPNGAGKSTILKLLTGIIQPDEGRIEIAGALRALIELGAGFHPLLTGRENIYLQGAIMGIPRREIDDRFEDIVEFAGIGDFLDSPVKFYSTGMHARLGFSIAIHFDPDILLVDEVLAVGDLSFQEKCMRQMERLRAQGKAVLMVTHSLFRIEALCDRAIWLEHGKCMAIGDSREVIKAYMMDRDRRSMEVSSATTVTGDASSPVSVEAVELVGEDGIVKNVFRMGEAMTVRISYNARIQIELPLFNLRIFHGGHGVLEAGMLIDGAEVDQIEGRGIVECRLSSLPLTPKVYELVIFARSKEGVVDILPMRTYATFQVSEEGVESWPMRGPMALNHLRQGSPVFVKRSWHFFDQKVDRERKS